MKKRQFLRAGLAATAAGVSAPALAQTLPSVRWRLASSFPKSLDTIFGGAEVLSRRVAAVTSGRFQISVHAAGELMPPFGVVDALQGAPSSAGTPLATTSWARTGRSGSRRRCPSA